MNRDLRSVLLWLLLLLFVGMLEVLVLGGTAGGRGRLAADAQEDEHGASWGAASNAPCEAAAADDDDDDWGCGCLEDEEEERMDDVVVILHPLGGVGRHEEGLLTPRRAIAPRSGPPSKSASADIPTSRSYERLH